MAEVQTYGIPDPEDERDPVTGEPVSKIPEQPTSGPPSPGGQANVSGAPLSGNQAADSRVGGPGPSEQGGFDPGPDRGNVETMVQETAHKDPDKFSDAIDATYQAIRSRRAKAGDKAAQLELELLNERMGINGEQAKEEMFRQAEVGLTRAEEDGTITKEQAKQKRWQLKNIYRIIKPEEMSLFLIDFGMRAMMAGETMGDLGALGAAGSGAMGALQERRRFAAEQDIAAGERAATDYAKAQELALEERRVGAAETTAQAALERAKGTGPGGRPYSGQDVWRREFLSGLGWSEDEIAAVLTGARTPEETFDAVYDDLLTQRQKAQQDEKMNLPDSMRAKVRNPEGKMVPVATLTNDEISTLARLSTESALKARGALRDKESPLERARAGAAGEQ